MGEGDDRGRSSSGSAAIASTSSRVSGRRSSSRARSARRRGSCTPGRLPGAVLDALGLRGSAHLFAVDLSPLAWPSPHRWASSRRRQHARRARKIARAPAATSRCRVVRRGAASVRPPVTQRRGWVPRRLLSDPDGHGRSSNSRGDAHERCHSRLARDRLRARLGDRRGARHHLPRQRVPGVELGLQRACSSCSPRARCRRCSCRPSSTCSNPAKTGRRRTSRPACSGSRSR